MPSILSNVAHIFQVIMSPKHGGDPMLESLQQLRSHLWGQNVIKNTQEGGKGFSNVDLTPFGIILNASNGNILLIRDEYELAYDTILENTQRLATGREGRSAFSVTGPEGVGKSYFLMYLLVRRMQERQPVAIHIGSLFALFDEKGVNLHAAECVKSAFFIPPGTWALSDPWHGDKEIHGPCMAFDYIQQAGTHIIHTGLAPQWARRQCAVVYDMKVWSLEELQALLTLLKLDLETGATLYEKFGANPRIITSILFNPEMEAQWKLVYCKDISDWQKASTSSHH